MGLKTWLGLKKQRANRRRPPSQHPEELPALLKLAAESTSYLEVGTRHGSTFNLMVRMMPKGSRAIAVDLPGGNWGMNSEAELRRVVSNLRDDGYDVHLFLGDSKDEAIVQNVRSLGPFDVALIDGDHLYDGAKAYWLNYGPLARTVVFHDIIGEGVVSRRGLPVEVPKLWQEIKDSDADTREVVGRGSLSGLGFVAMPERVAN